MTTGAGKIASVQIGVTMVGGEYFALRVDRPDLLSLNNDIERDYLAEARDDGTDREGHKRYKAGESRMVLQGGVYTSLASTRRYDGWGVLLGQTPMGKALGDAPSGLAGWGLFQDWPDAPKLLVGKMAIRSAIFSTRAQAREALKLSGIKRTWPRAKVVKLKATMEVTS